MSLIPLRSLVSALYQNVALRMRKASYGPVMYGFGRVCHNLHTSIRWVPQPVSKCNEAFRVKLAYAFDGFALVVPNKCLF